MRFVVISCILLGLALRCRIQSLTHIGEELTEIKAFCVVEILRFEVVGLVEIWCGIIYFVRIGHEM